MPAERPPLVISRDLAEILREIATQQQETAATVAVQANKIERLEDNQGRLIKDVDYLLTVVRDGGKDNSLIIRQRDTEGNIKKLEERNTHQDNLLKGVGSVILAVILALIGAVATLLAGK